MRSLSQKKLKRIFSKRSRASAKGLLRRIVGSFETSSAQVIQNRAYFSSEEIGDQTKVQEPKYSWPQEDIPGEYFAPDPEVVRHAFSYAPRVSKKDLLHVKVGASLEKSGGVQEWADWWEEGDANSVIETGELAALKAKYAGIGDLA